MYICGIYVYVYTPLTHYMEDNKQWVIVTHMQGRMANKEILEV